MLSNLDYGVTCEFKNYSVSGGTIDRNIQIKNPVFFIKAEQDLSYNILNCFLVIPCLKNRE